MASFRLPGASRTVKERLADGLQIYRNLSILTISSNCDKQLISQSIRPAGSNGQSTIAHDVHWPLLIFHFDAVTSAGSFLCGQWTVCTRSVLDATSFLWPEVSDIIHPLRTGKTPLSCSPPVRVLVENKLGPPIQMYGKPNYRELRPVVFPKFR